MKPTESTLSASVAKYLLGHWKNQGLNPGSAFV